MVGREFISLLDMVLKLEGHEVAYTYGYLANAYGISGNEPLSRPIDNDQKLTLLEALDALQPVCEKLELPVTLRQFSRVRGIVKSSTTYGEAHEPINELRLRMHDELKSRVFLFVPPLEARFYNRKEPFGLKVSQKFAKAITDIENAGDCIAVGMSTAAVFHLMRVMERAVQKLGKRIGVKLVGEKNWQNILDEINKAIKNMPDSPSSAKKKKASLAAASANLFNVKLAWRNPVMHPKESYSPEEAVEIYETTQRFMEHLASIL